MLQRQWIFLVTVILIVILTAAGLFAGYLWYLDKDLNVLAFFFSSVAALILFLFYKSQIEQEQDDVLKEQTRLKRQLEEHHLVIEKHEFDSNYAFEQVRKMKKEIQKKNTTLIQLADVLSESMEEQIKVLNQDEPDLDTVLQHSKVMLKFSADLDTLAQLSFPTQKMLYNVERFDSILQKSIDEFQLHHQGSGKFFQIKTEEEQILIQKNPEHLVSLFQNLFETIYRLSQSELIEVSLISYIDAEMGDSVRVAITYKQVPEFSGDSMEFFNQYQKLHDSSGRDNSPGLGPVIIKVLAGYLDGHISHSMKKADEAAIVLVLPLGKGNDFDR